MRILLIILLSITARLFITEQTQASDIVLAPGTAIATPVAARDAARKADKPVRIIVQDGEYNLTEPLLLDATDSQVTWEAAPGATPVISGGKEIRSWTKTTDGLWKATLSDKSWKFEQLWINGKRATRARTPNKGYFNIAEGVGPNVFPGLDKDLNFHVFSLYPQQYDIIKAIPKEEQPHVLLTVTHAWAVGQCRIKALNDDYHAVEIKGRARYPFVEFEPDQRYWLENFRSALDAPGEWFLDAATGAVFYKPLAGEDVSTAKIVAPVADHFCILKNAKDITFKGISFQHANYLYPADGLHDMQAAMNNGGAFEITDSSDIHFENCEIKHTGEHGIVFKNGCADSTISHCLIEDLGGSGIIVGELSRPDDNRVNHHIVIDDCIIRHGGRLHPSACGVTFTHTQFCAIKQCDIGDFYYTGVSAGWNWGYGDTSSRETLVENNHIHHLGWAYLSDMGGFYGLGTSPGTVVRGNHVHHINSHRYGGWGLYTDEGSADVQFLNNLVHDTWNSGFHQHYGYFNTVRNNIFAFGHSAQIQRSRFESRLCFRYDHNIVIWDPAVPLLDGGEWNWKLNDTPDRGEPKDTVVFKNNLYWPTDGKIPAFLCRDKYTWEEWKKMGRDKNSLFADPLFEDVEARDFRLKPESPASKIGFKPWDLTIAGVNKTDPAWRKKAEQGNHYPNWETDAKPQVAPAYRQDLQTYESATISGTGIRNGTCSIPQGEADVGQGASISSEAASPLPVSGTKVSRKSLKIQDMPNLSHSYDPILDIKTNWQEGTYQVKFDAMAQTGADWFFEMRSNGEYGAGPMVSWKNGILTAGIGDKVKMAAIPAGDWYRIEIDAKTGTGKYDVIVTLKNGKQQEFKDLPCKPTWNAPSYLLFSGLGTTKTAFFIDNISLLKTDKE
jgi:hypothetical protein